jgi:hypothetical protein
MEPVFVPAMKYLTSKQETRWVRGIWFAPQAKAFFPAIAPEHAKLVLDNLLTIDRIDHQLERLLSLIAETNASLVWDFFKHRVEWKKDVNSRYEAVPYELHTLRAQLAQDSARAVLSLRQWPQSSDGMFRFTGGRLLHSVFPTFTEPLGNSLSAVIAAGGNNDITFVIHVLENYCGEPAMHHVVKEMVALLPEDDERLNHLCICLGNTGVVSGEFGMVDANRNKKAAITAWLEDSDPKIRKFSEAYLRDLEIRIASEQRRADQSRALRRLNFDAERDSAQ